MLLGNHKRVLFRSRRHARAFQADAERFLNECLFEVNALLIDAFSELRNAWFLFRNHNRINARLKQIDDTTRTHIQDAWRSMDLAVDQVFGANGVFMAWKHVASATASLQALALLLRDFHVARNRAVERARMELLIRRCNTIAEALRHYGNDVDTAVRSISSLS
ncbi:MAG: hypothetical protein QM724_09160 [Flavobacteriales bacterium]